MSPNMKNTKKSKEKIFKNSYYNGNNTFYC